MAKAKQICACTPSLGLVSMWWARQFTNLLWPLNMGRQVMMKHDSVGGEIAETRNSIVVDCLNLETDSLEVDSLFWVDDDVLLTRGALVQLYSHHKPIVAGCYFTKSDPSIPLLFPERMGGTAPFVPNKVVPMWGVGMGVTLVKMDVYKALIPKVGRDKYGRPEWYRTNREYKVEDGMLDCGGTEDLFFCELAAKEGITPIADCSKHAFGWHHDRETGQGYPKEQFDQWKSAKQIVWPDGTVWE